MEKQILIDQFHKNSIETVKIHLQTWKAQEYIDVRVWHLDNPAEVGSERPTHKGITLNVELLAKLVQALEKTREVLRKDRAGSKDDQEANEA